MAEFYVWDEKLLGLDVKDMDEEHIILISKMNALHKAYFEKKPSHIINQCLIDFADYTVKHFSDEEEYMAKINFVGLQTHKLNHKKLLDRVNEFITNFEKTGLLTEEFFQFLSVWLTTHIRGIDFKYANKLP